jgi:hypothetical protein
MKCPHDPVRLNIAAIASNSCNKDIVVEICIYFDLVTTKL